MKKSYKVMREHRGDKFYKRGDLREAVEGDVKHLVTRGILVEAKSEEKPKNQAEEGAPENASEDVEQNDMGEGSEKTADETPPKTKKRHR